MSNITSITLSSGNVTSSGSFSTLDNSFGTAGTSNINVLSIQGVAGGVSQSVTGTLSISGTSPVTVVNGITTVAVSGTSNVTVVNGITTVAVSGTSNVSVVNGVTSVAISGTGSVSVVNANPNGRAVAASSAPVVLNSQTYTSVAASSATTLMGSSGAIGDYLDTLNIVPASVSPGAVTISDGTSAAMTVFAGGTTSLSNLVPFQLSVGAVARGAGWHVTTNSSVSVISIGTFT